MARDALARAKRRGVTSYAKPGRTPTPEEIADREETNRKISARDEWAKLAADARERAEKRLKEKFGG